MHVMIYSTYLSIDFLYSFNDML